MVIIDHLETTVDEDVFLVFSEPEDILPVDEDAVWVGNLLLGVPLGVVVVDAHPGGPGGEPSVLLFVPLGSCSVFLLKKGTRCLHGLPGGVYEHDP